MDSIAVARGGHYTCRITYVAKLASFLPLTIFILEFVFFSHSTDIQELLLSMVLISTMFIFINKK